MLLCFKYTSLYNIFKALRGAKRNLIWQAPLQWMLHSASCCDNSCCTSADTPTNHPAVVFSLWEDRFHAHVRFLASVYWDQVSSTTKSRDNHRQYKQLAIVFILSMATPQLLLQHKPSFTHSSYEGRGFHTRCQCPNPTLTLMFTDIQPSHWEKSPCWLQGLGIEQRTFQLVDDPLPREPQWPISC